MELLEQAYRLLPDIVVITDLYWYILDYNRDLPGTKLRKGISLSRIIPDCKELSEGKFYSDGRIFRRNTTPVYENEIQVGYVVYLVDITEKEKLMEQSIRKRTELEQLTREQARANAELEEYLHQAEALLGYEEQLRIARNIHDDTGHAITALNTISQMCLQLRETDPGRFRQLIRQGIDLCEKSTKEAESISYSSLRDLLESFQCGCAIPVEVLLDGEEPAFTGKLYSVIRKILEEAYHNTLSHSLADRMLIEAHMTPEKLILQIKDNGKFRGTLEKGFGLTTMEENIKASGGTVRFRAEENQGFEITAEWSETP